MRPRYLKTPMDACKYCGGNGTAWRTKDATGTHYHVRCLDPCCIAYELYHRRFATREEAIAAWNKCPPRKEASRERV